MTRKEASEAYLQAANKVEKLKSAIKTLAFILDDDTVTEGLSSVYCSVDEIVLVYPSNMSFGNCIMARRKVSAIIGEPWKLGQVWNSGNTMLVSYKFGDSCIEMWYQADIAIFPMNQILPGCYLEKSTTEISNKYHLVCEAKL